MWAWLNMSSSHDLNDLIDVHEGGCIVNVVLPYMLIQPPIQFSRYIVNKLENSCLPIVIAIS